MIIPFVQWDIIFVAGAVIAGWKAAVQAIASTSKSEESEPQISATESFLDVLQGLRVPVPSLLHCTLLVGQVRLSVAFLVGYTVIGSLTPTFCCRVPRSAPTMHASARCSGCKSSWAARLLAANQQLTE